MCDAAAAAWIDPGRVSFARAVRIVRRAIGPGFPPQQAERLLARVAAEITRKMEPLPRRHGRSYPRVVKRWRTRYDLKKPGDHGTRHYGPPAIRLASPAKPNPTNPASTS
jgi:hypothetical protein